MGSWNGSCFFSGLSIDSGTPAVIFPMMKKNNVLEPALFPIYGEYNDYGSLEGIADNAINLRVLELFKKYGAFNNTPKKKEIKESSLAKKELNEIFKDQSSDKKENMERIRELMNIVWGKKNDFKINYGSDWKYGMDSKKIDTVENLVRAMEREDCRENVLEVYLGSEKYSLIFIMVHGAVWGAIKDYMKAEPDYQKQDPAGEYGYSDCTGEECIADILSKLPIGLTQHRSFKPHEKIEDLYLAIDKNIYYGGYADTLPHHLIFENEELFEGLISIGGPIDESLKNAFADSWYFASALKKARRTLSSTAQAGSQADNQKFVRHLNTSVVKICDDWLKERAACEEEDDE